MQRGGGTRQGEDGGSLSWNTVDGEGWGRRWRQLHHFGSVCGSGGRLRVPTGHAAPVERGE
jgi:hypothetical protein